MVKKLLLTAGLAIVLAGCATPQRTVEAPRFNEDQSANLIVRYYSDSTSYVLKPQRTEGKFLSLFTRDQILDTANQLQNRELAVVVIGTYSDKSLEQQVIVNWNESLNDLGFKRTVFVRGSDGANVRGLPIITAQTASATGTRLMLASRSASNF